MKLTSSIALFLGILFLFYGLYNCNCNKETFANTKSAIQSTKNYEKVKGIIEKEMQKIDQINKKNKDLLMNTQNLTDFLSKINNPK
jgi:hypothetical protein